MPPPPPWLLLLPPPPAPWVTAAEVPTDVAKGVDEVAAAVGEADGDADGGDDVLSRFCGSLSRSRSRSRSPPRLKNDRRPLDDDDDDDLFPIPPFCHPPRRASGSCSGHVVFFSSEPQKFPQFVQHQCIDSKKKGHPSVFSFHPGTSIFSKV